MHKRIWINADGLRCCEGSELQDEEGHFDGDFVDVSEDADEEGDDNGEDDRLEKLSEMIAKIEEDSAKATKRTEEMIAALQRSKDPQPNNYHDEPLPCMTQEQKERLRNSVRLFPNGIWGSIKPVLIRLAKPLPCLSVWAGMTATFFWNSLKNLPEQPFEGILDLPDGTPEQAIAAGLQTAVFLIWVMAFRSTIRSAIRKEFSEGASH